MVLSIYTPPFPQKLTAEVRFNLPLVVPSLSSCTALRDFVCKYNILSVSISEKFIVCFYL